MQPTQLPRDYWNLFWTEEEHFEMAIRNLIQPDFFNLLGDSLPFADLSSLKNVIFGILYPCTSYRNQNKDRSMMRGQQI